MQSLFNTMEKKTLRKSLKTTNNFYEEEVGRAIINSATLQGAKKQQQTNKKEDENMIYCSKSPSTKISSTLPFRFIISCVARYQIYPEKTSIWIVYFGDVY